MTTYNINSAVTNIGEGSVNTGDIIENDITQYVTDQKQQEKFKEIISGIKDLVEQTGNVELMNR